MGRTEPWHKRHAVHLVAQLPENAADALIILAAATEFVEKFLVEGLGSPRSGVRVVEPPVQLFAKEAPIARPEPIHTQSRGDSDQ